MPDLHVTDPDEAAERVRELLGLSASTPAETRRVRRLDRPDLSYYLVVFGSDGAVGVGTADQRTGEPGTAATLPGTHQHLTLDEHDAAALAGAPPGAAVELVWRPCRASRSPLYPLWEVTLEHGAVHVDQGGTVWSTLEDPEPGGGSPAV